MTEYNTITLHYRILGPNASTAIRRILIPLNKARLKLNDRVLKWNVTSMDGNVATIEAQTTKPVILPTPIYDHHQFMWERYGTNMMVINPEVEFIDSTISTKIKSSPLTKAKAPTDKTKTLSAKERMEKRLRELPKGSHPSKDTEYMAAYREYRKLLKGKK